MSTFYSKTHEKITIEGAVATLAISDYAVKELGDIVYVELPEVGQSVSAGDSIIVVESVKAASDVYTPVSGKVVEINEEASDDPSLINDLESGSSWFIKIDLSNPSECDNLMDESDYLSTISS